MKLNLLTIALLCVLSVTLVLAADFTPQGNINLRDVYNITGAPYINATTLYGNASQTTGVLTSVNEGNLNVNRSTYWGAYHIATDLNNLLTLNWANITSKFITAIDDVYIYMSGTTATLNETKLNNTISNVERNWTKLDNYPVACPANSFLTELNDSVTCTSIDEISITELNSTKINSVLYVQAGNGSDIQVKIDEANNGDKIIIPSGNYNISSTITSDKTLIIEGMGLSTEIKPNANFNVMEFINKTTLRNFYINASETTSANLRDGIRLLGNNYKADNSIVENVRIDYVTRAGIYVTAPEVIINNVKINNPGYGTDEGRGIWMNSDYGRIINCYVKNSSRYGYELQNGIGTEIQGSHVNGSRRSNLSSGRGFYLVETNYSSVIGGSSTGASLTGVYVNGGYYNTIHNVNIFNVQSGNSSEARGILVTNGGYNTINLNRIDNLSTQNMSVDSVGIIIQSDTIMVTNNIISNVDLGIDQQAGRDYINLLGNKMINVETNYSLSGTNAEFFVEHGLMRIGHPTLINPRISFRGSNTAIRGIDFLLSDDVTVRGGVRMDANEDIEIDGDEVYFETGGTERMRITSDTVNITDGNVSMHSPNGTEYSCGVNNGGTFTCV